MKRLIMAALIFIFLTTAFAADIELGWDANEEPEVIGYNLYVKNHVNEDWRLLSEIPEDGLENPLFPRIKLWGLSNTLIYYFVLTAYSDEEESGYSNEVVWAYETKPTEEPKAEPQTELQSNGGGCFISTIMGEDNE